MVEPYTRTPSFTARLSHHMTELGAQQTIVLDSVLINNGNSYSPVTGVFTAPKRGTYLFFGSILSHYSDYVETEITVNGNKVLAYLYSKGTNSYDQGSNMAIVHLEAGDKVWMRLIGHEGTKVFGNGWCTFSGYRISE